MKRILSMLMALVMALSLFPAIHAHAESDTNHPQTEPVEQLCDTARDAISFVHSMMLQRVSSFTVKLPIGEYASDTLRSIYSHAVSPNTEPSEGDSMLYQSVPLELDVDIKDGFAYLRFSFLYLTTAQEEAALDQAMEALIAEFACDPKNTHYAFRKIYDWVCANVAFVGNSDDPYDYTAYGAMMNRRASSQGFALLVYQLARKMGLNCRVVTGTLDGNFHAWNTIRIEPRDYNVDAALDAGKNAYSWFLIGDDHMTGHERDPDPIALYLPTCPRNYHDTPNLCQTVGHKLVGGSCVTGRICSVCGFREEPQEHLFPGEFATECYYCGYVRYVACQGTAYRLVIMGVSESDPPRLELDEGVSVTQVDAYAQSDSVYCWVRELVFPQTGEYTVTARFENRQDAVYEFRVFEHSYYSDRGICMICGYEDENFHPHQWQEATCEESRTCTVCGETQGEPRGHIFQSDDCTKNPGVCVYCGFTQQEPPGHTYSSNHLYQCAVCGRPRQFGCDKAATEYWFSVQQSEGFRLTEADPGLTVAQGEYELRGDYHWWQYLFTGEPGQYDVTFLNLGTGEAAGLTVLIEPHAYVNGACPHCGERDPGVHFHDWIDATCYEPKTCATCGLTEGSPREHDLENTPCTQPRHCRYCDLVMEAPSHLYREGESKCTFCGQERITVCPGQGLELLLSSGEAGDFALTPAIEGVWLALTEYFTDHGVHYWVYTVTCAEVGTYEVLLKQKGSEETLGVTLVAEPHAYIDGVCGSCGGLEEAGHVHSWRSATCTKPATCTECGQTQGEPLDHDYGSYRCTEYAVCARCRQNRGPVKHTYDDRNDEFCNVCNQPRICLCFGEELTLYLRNRREEGFWLEDKPAGVTLKKEYTFLYGGDIYYEHKYLLGFHNTGSFELKFVDEDYEEHVYLTVDVYAHEYENGFCTACGKVDPDQHIHDWAPATCYAPSKCAQCGAEEGEALGHSFQNGECVRCGWIGGTNPGDVVADGIIDYLDAMEVLKAAVGLVTLTQEQFALADVDGDGEVTYLDAMQILRWAVGLS